MDVGHIVGSCGPPCEGALSEPPNSYVVVSPFSRGLITGRGLAGSYVRSLGSLPECCDWLLASELVTSLL